MTSSVDSRISPKRYESLLSEIEEEDRNIRSELYELSIYDHTIMISPGKTIEDEEIKDLVYCYVYAVKNDKVIHKLGVYERFTKEKEEFFDLTTFGKGTLCLFEKYETNPSLFLEFKTDEEKETKKKPKSKSKKSKPDIDLKHETEDPNEIDLNASEAPAKSKTPVPVDPNEIDLNAPEAPPKSKTPVPVDPPVVDPNEIDLNAPEAPPKSKTPVPVDPNEIDLNAPDVQRSETKKSETPIEPLIDINKLERDLGIEQASPKKSKIKLKSKSATPKAETPKAETPKAETPKAEKPKTRTKKAKPIDQGEVPGTKFG